MRITKRYGRVGRGIGMGGEKGEEERGKERRGKGGERRTQEMEGSENKDGNWGISGEYGPVPIPVIFSFDIPCNPAQVWTGMFGSGT